MHVEETRLAGVDALPQVFVALVRCAPRDRVGAGQFAIQRVSGRGPGHHRDLERPAGGMFGARPRGERAGYHLRGTRRSEAAAAQRLAIAYQRGGLVGGENRKWCIHSIVT
jgi:hypothetical protein